MPLRPVSRTVRGIVAFSAFLLAYVALFIGVPPISLCLLGSCALSPRPEAFLLAAALPFGLWAILGVGFGVFSAALLYEWINPMGTTSIDATAALLVFLVSCWLGRWYLLRRPSIEGVLIATWIITGLVSLLLGTYAYGVKGHGIPGAYMGILAEAIIPINVAGAAFLAWTRQRRIGEVPES
ncbi:MAG: hypothetical protein ACE5HJ_02620 [Thermoplasmata archaeon]